MADAPPLEPLALDDVKLNLRVDSDAEDGLIRDLITDAREHVERETDLILVPRVITETMAPGSSFIELASWPVNAIEAIRYPSAGGATTLPSGAWQTSLKSRPVRLLPTAIGWGLSPLSALPGIPVLPVEVDVAAGYMDPTLIPRTATRAMHLLIAHWYANRSAAEVGARAAAIEIPLGVDVLLQRLRLTRV